MKKIILLLLLVIITTFAAELIIVHDESTQLNKRDIQQIYLGRKQYWHNDVKIIVTTYANGTLQDSFLRFYLNKNGRNFMLYWKQLVFTGRGVMPKSFDTEEELIRYIAETPGAIGYISPGLKEQVPENIRVLESLE